MNKLKLGVINLMPNAKEYFALIEGSLASVRASVELIPIRLRTHDSRSSQNDAERWSYPDDHDGLAAIDLLLVSGAPVEHLPFEEIRYWRELCTLFADTQTHGVPVMGLCWGGLAIAKYLGVEKRQLPEKAFGVHSAPVTEAHRHYFGDDCSAISMALSTWALLDEGSIDAARGGPLKSIVRHPGFGNLMMASADDHFVFVLGHPEYTVERLHMEWRRDIAKDIPYARSVSENDFADMASKLEHESRPILANWIQRHLASSSAATGQTA